MEEKPPPPPPGDSPERPARPDFTNVESINSLDTARMALRWALERMDSIQKDKAALAERAELQAKEISQLKKDSEILSRTLSLRAQEQDERELYYQKMEEFVSKAVSGRIDLKALAEREQETERMRAFLLKRQEGLEKEYESRRESIEKEYRALKYRLEEEAESRQRRAQEALEERRKNLDNSHLARLSEANEREIRLRAQESALSERERRFDDFYRKARAQLDAEIKNLKEEVRVQAEFKVKSAEDFLGWRQGVIEDSWRAEKAKLLSEIAQWRRKAEEALPRTLELEKESSRAREYVLRLEQELELFKEKAGRDLASWEAENQKLQKELEFWTLRAKKSPVEAAQRIAEWSARQQGDLESAGETLFESAEALEEENHKRAAEWEGRRRKFNSRERLWHERLRARQTQLDEQAFQIEVLKSALLKAVHNYKGRSAQGTPPEKGEEVDADPH